MAGEKAGGYGCLEFFFVICLASVCSLLVCPGADFVSAAATMTPPASDYVWPGNAWAKALPAEVGLDEARLSQARDYALSGGGSGFIARGGRLVFSWGDPATLYDLKSSSKSIGATALGVALLDGKVKLDDRASLHHPAFGLPPESNAQNGWLDQITLRHLADQTAGFDKPGGYGRLLFSPGTHWHYSDGGPNWLAECLTLAYGRDLNEVMFGRVFTPLCITTNDIRWRKHAYRPELLNGLARREFGSGLSANVNAMARLGYLYLRGGKWQSQQIIHSDFVQLAGRPAKDRVDLPELDQTMGNPSAHYSLLWWNNGDGTIAQVPRDAFWAWGLYDSLIVVIPSLDLVVSRAGASWARTNDVHYDAIKPFLVSITAAAQSQAATEPSAEAIPSWFRKAPALPPPQGDVIRVRTADDFLAAADRIGAGGTILLADGEYKLPRTLVLTQKKDVTIRSASGNPAKVTLIGNGWDGPEPGGDILHIGRCDGVTIADLTLTDCRSYGIKVEAENAPRNVHIYNVRFRNIGVRAVKGSAGSDPEVRAVKGSVRFCHFENTRVPPAHWLFGGDYIAAIDMMALEDWTFSDNVFRNIKGRNGGGRAAIFIWVRSRRVTVERNLIVDCDRGVAFGNPGQSTANHPGERLVYVADGIVRNNFIAGGADCGVELWHGERLKVYNNTIWRPEQNWSRGIRIGAGVRESEIANNLVHGAISNEGGEAQLRNNLIGRFPAYFVDPSAGNLVLTSSASEAIDKGVPLPEVTDDIRGKPRLNRPDIGAWETEQPR
jgi:CubicO group peptidase (beta-lactamase class C family)